ncbi:hypothetical protein GALMADRAFT_599470 [Galerina marginata CBS 339.88]|uniref:NET domain-containing protein n=1 Tax=Galerina marginata (strain CBS 339.88) TaxID=685588 RepID=A0A067T2A7_GALM3|nr:hypothetical protein GALMADRAFT_599470 [Galerina marginata CBS 339.88]
MDKAQFKASAKTKSYKKLKKADEDILTFWEKKDLTKAVGNLDGPALEQVIQIINDGVPEIRESTEEVELEFDQLPAAVLTKLYKYVFQTMRQPLPTPNSNDAAQIIDGNVFKYEVTIQKEELEKQKTCQLEDRSMTTDDGQGLSFEQKKYLAESIGKLDGPRLERLIQIFQEDVPEARNNPEEIEIDIDALPAATLIKLYKYVVESKCEPRQPKHILLGST